MVKNRLTWLLTVLCQVICPLSQKLSVIQASEVSAVLVINTHKNMTEVGQFGNSLDTVYLCSY